MCGLQLPITTIFNGAIGFLWQLQVLDNGTTCWTLEYYHRPETTKPCLSICVCVFLYAGAILINFKYVEIIIIST